jgi:hypothetical protein
VTGSKRVLWFAFGDREGFAFIGIRCDGVTLFLIPDI